MSDHTTEPRTSGDNDLDQIGQLMMELTKEEKARRREHAQPHWEVLYNAEHDDFNQIVHLHAGEKAPAPVIATPDGRSVARCNECGGELQLSPGKSTGAVRLAAAPVM
jgi:hypothetical protein